MPEPSEGATLSSPPDTGAGERLVGLLTEQLERGAFAEARETVAALLRQDPEDQDARDIQAFLDEQMSVLTSGQVGEVRCLQKHKTWINAVAFSPDGRRALSGSGGILGHDGFQDGDDCSLLLWEIDSGRKLARLRSHRTAVNCLAYSRDARKFVSGSRGGGICLWDALFLTPIRQFQRSGSAIWSLAFSPDGRQVLCGSAEPGVTEWNVADGRLLRTLEGHTSGVSAVAYAPDGQRIVTGSFDRTVRVWDAESGQPLHCLRGHAQMVSGLAVLADGKQVLSSSLDRTVRLWDLGTGQEVRRFAGHTSRVNAVAFSPEGRFVITAGADQTVRLWDVTNGVELRRFQGHADSVTAIAFSPDGRLALSGSRDRTVRLWQLPSVLDAIPTATSVFNLVEALAQSRILNAGQVAQLTQDLQLRFTELRALAWHLIERGWVTPYQINQLILGRGSELVLGDYIILDRLGEGGMGRVLKARRGSDPQPLALKVAREQLFTAPGEANEFWWECQVLGRLDHPNVVKSFDAQRDNDPPFFTMEYLEGTDLEKRVRRSGPLPVGQACACIRQTALALQHAHERHLIHRDIKPANLLQLHAEDATPFIKVIDWGIANVKGTPDDPALAENSATKGQAAGTPDYLAPEQAVAPDTADTRSDIYSLGCTLYQLLTGKPPFHGGSFIQKLVKHQQTEATPIRQLRPEVPEGLQAVVQRMLAKQPADRYQTPHEVAAALAPFAAEDIGRAAPPPDERRAGPQQTYRLPVVCRLLHSVPEVCWEAEIQQVNRGGLTLHSPREARQGAILAVEWRASEAKQSRRVRVVHARPEGTTGYWHLGCAFSKGLTADELRSLQGERVQDPLCFCQ
ncbi:MAG: protein kinase [Planctomycetia bacterium]|nr:protein kinase [Planctomycetia bacterium]